MNDSNNLNITTTSGTIITGTAGGTAGDLCYYATPDYQEPVVITPAIWPAPLNNNNKGGDDMRYLYEVILINPKNDEFRIDQAVARSETSALMKVYNESQFSIENNVPFDDLKTSCRVLMEWKKEKSLKKAIETIKKAVE